MITNTNRNFEIWVETKKFESTWKKEGESSKRNRWSVKFVNRCFNAGPWSLDGVSLASKYGRFFFSLARLIEDSERQLNSASYDSLEFLVRRLDEYERTLATLTSRFCETYGCVPAQQNTVADLSYLCNRVAFLRSHFQRSLDCDDNSVVISTPGNIRPLQIEHCNRPAWHTSHQKLIQVAPPPPGCGSSLSSKRFRGPVVLQYCFQWKASFYSSSNCASCLKICSETPEIIYRRMWGVNAWRINALLCLLFLSRCKKTVTVLLCKQVGSKPSNKGLLSQCQKQTRLGHRVRFRCFWKFPALLYVPQIWHRVRVGQGCLTCHPLFCLFVCLFIAQAYW